eukprot:g7165.t1
MISSFRCFLRSLSWWSPVLSSSVEQMQIDEGSWHLVIISSDSMLCLYHLGTHGDSTPIFRTSLQPKSRSGATNLTSVVPLPPEHCAFQAICIFSDGSRLKACLDPSSHSFWDTATRWTQIDWKSSLQFLTISNQSLPLEQNQPAWKLTHFNPSLDGNYCLICQTSINEDQSTISVLQLLDADAKRKPDSGAILFNKLHTFPGQIQCLMQQQRHSTMSINTNSSLFVRSDLISQQLRDRTEDSFLLLTDRGYQVLRLVKPVQILSGILTRLGSSESALDQLKDFCWMYGVTETAAMVVLTGHGLAGALLQNSELFHGPRFIEKSRWEWTGVNPMTHDERLNPQRQIIEGIGVTPVERIRDLEFSHCFQGVLLVLRQIVREIWWKLVFQIQKHPVTGEVVAETSFQAKDLRVLKESFQKLYVFLKDLLVPYDPQCGSRVLVTSEVFNIERFELRGIVLLVERCIEAIRLLQFFQGRVHIDCIVRMLSESELDAMKELTFKKMVTASKDHSPVNGLMKATVKLNEKFPASVNDILQFFAQKAPSYMNESDKNQIKALHGLNQVMETYLPKRDPMQLKVVNGPDRYWRD